jgi:hypothetical protein
MTALVLTGSTGNNSMMPVLAVVSRAAITTAVASAAATSVIFSNLFLVAHSNSSARVVRRFTRADNSRRAVRICN